MAISYKLEASWALMWYPLPGAAANRGLVMRSGSATHSSDEFTPVRSVIHSVDFGVVPAPGAFIQVGVTQDLDRLYDVDIEVQLGARRKNKHLVIDPDSRIPFMVCLDPIDEPGLANTAVVFHGVIETGPRPFLEDFVTRIEKIFGVGG